MLKKHQGYAKAFKESEHGASYNSLKVMIFKRHQLVARSEVKMCQLDISMNMLKIFLAF